MTFGQNGGLVALPNVLRDQAASNTLGGLRAVPERPTRLRLPLGALLAAAVTVLTLAALLATRGV